MFEVSLAGAFLGGVLALLSPCSALLLPSFFAYAFKSKRRLLARTLVYYAGLCTLFIPLGIGASFAGALVLDYRSTAILVAGAVLIVFGVLELLGMGFSWIPQRWVTGPSRIRTFRCMPRASSTGLPVFAPDHYWVPSSPWPPVPPRPFPAARLGGVRVGDGCAALSLSLAVGSL